ncbi:MAG: hypothetical protein IT552_02540 [Sphingomonadaceae bacterium]|nr:hypothetical protein [Sphingomonadaceae bacterium]
MSYWYSPSTCGFYPTNRKGKGKPKDAVLVTAAEHEALFPPDQPQREIETGPDGKPRWRSYGLSEKRRDAMFAIKAEAARRIDAIMPLHRQLNALRAGDDSIETCADFASIDAIRVASNLIEQDMLASDDPEAFPVATHPLWPEKKA